MADLICAADGNFTAAATWGLVDTTSKLVDANTGTTNLGTGNSDSATFTPGAITVDGIALRLASRAAGSPTNVLTVTLRNSTDGVDVISVAVSVADLPVCSTTDDQGGWFFAKFASAQLLEAGKAYLVRCSLNATTTAVALYRNATANNHQRMLRTTTTQAPAAGDDLHIMGEYAGGGGITARTVTMDSTAATDYGAAAVALRLPAFTISKSGTLTYGTAAATDYVLRISGHMIVYSGGVFTIGTTATPIPRGSTAVLEFDSVAISSQTGGSFGLSLYNEATFAAQGLSRTSGKDVVWCLLNTNEAAGQTVLGVDADTGWLSGDEIAIASTSRSVTEAEARTLASDAGAASLTITAALTNAHLGTAPTQAEVILLTRNVKIRATGTGSVSGYINVWDTAVTDIDWVEFRYMGAQSPVAALMTATTGSGSCSAQYCAFRDWNGYVFNANQSDVDNFTFRYNVGYSLSGNYSNILLNVNLTSGVNWTISDNVFVRGHTSQTGFQIGDLGGSISRNRITGFSTAFYLASIADDGSSGDFDDNVAHSNGGYGFNWPANSWHARRTFNRLVAWRNSASGFYMAATSGVTAIPPWRQVRFVDLRAFGNLNFNVEFLGMHYSCVADGWMLAADTTFATTNGVNWSGASFKFCQWRFNNCDFGVADGIYAAHTNDINFALSISTTSLFQWEFWNCRFGSANEWAGNLLYLMQGSAIRSTRHDGTATRHKTVFFEGTVEDEQAIFVSAAPSAKLSPSANAVAAFRFEGVRAYAAVNSGETVAFSVRVRKDASYTGSAPRLVMKANPAIGLNADVVLDTHTAAADAWEELTGTTAAVNADGVVEAVVDCDGGAGAVYVDDFVVV